MADAKQNDDHYYPNVREVLARIFPNEYNPRWEVSFDDDGVSYCHGLRGKGDDCDWELVPRSVMISMTEIMIKEHLSAQEAVHRTHCNSGEYVGSCKYGDENCPVRVDAPMLGGGLGPVEWLRALVLIERKRGATKRAQEAEQIASWLEQRLENIR